MSTIKDERSIEQRYISMLGGLYGRFKSNYDTICAVLGEEQGLKLINEMSRCYALELVERAKAKLPDTGINSVAGYIMRIFTNVSLPDKKGTSTDGTGKERFVFKAEKCPLRLDNYRICLAHTNMEKVLVETLNPELTHRVGMSLAKGDPYCEHIVEYKK